MKNKRLLRQRNLQKPYLVYRYLYVLLYQVPCLAVVRVLLYVSFECKRAERIGPYSRAVQTAVELRPNVKSKKTGKQLVALCSLECTPQAEREQAAVGPGIGIL